MSSLSERNTLPWEAAEVPPREKIWFKGELQRFCWKLKTHSEDPKRGENRLQTMLNSGFHCLRDNYPFKVLKNTAQFSCFHHWSGIKHESEWCCQWFASWKHQTPKNHVENSFTISHPWPARYLHCDTDQYKLYFFFFVKVLSQKKELILHLFYIPWAIVGEGAVLTFSVFCIVTCYSHIPLISPFYSSSETHRGVEWPSQSKYEIMKGQNSKEP